MRSAPYHILYVALLAATLLLPFQTMGEIPAQKPTAEEVAKSWNWAKNDQTIKNPKNIGKARKLRKKSAAAAAQEESQRQGWAMLGDGLCALSGAVSCANDAAVFENSLKSNSSKTVELMKKGER